MASLTDDVEISNLLTTENYDPSMSKYNQSDYQYIVDSNNGSYSDAILRFDLSPLRQQYTILKDAYLQIPFNLVASGGTFTAASLLTVKESLVDLISSVQVRDSSGNVIVNDLNTNMMARIRNLVEHDQDWYTQEAGSSMFVKDSISNPTGACGIVNPVNTTVTGSTYNDGYSRRIGLFKQQATFSGSTFSFVATIKLSEMHDFFDQMDFPLYNANFQLSLGVSGIGNNTQFSPFVVDSGISSAVIPTLTIATATPAGTSTSISSCRLYYRTVKFAPEVNTQILQKLSTQWVKRVRFRVADVYTPASGESATTNFPINRLLNPATLNPLRVWVLLPAAGSLSTSGGNANSGLSNYIGGLTNANVLINNEPYFTNYINDADSFYTLLKQNMPSEGGLISKQEFLSTYRIHVFDLSRVKSRILNPHSACSIMVTAQRSDSASVDYYYIVERAAWVDLNLNSGDVKVVGISL